MRRTDCRREAPPHGYTTYGVEGRYLAARLYPHTMGLVRGGERDGVELLKKWHRQRMGPVVPEDLPLRWHPILGYLRLLGIIIHWPPNAVRCSMTRCSRSLTQRDVSPVAWRPPVDSSSSQTAST
jgi:hypothetical protein